MILWRTILKKLQEGKALLKLIQTEFMKLRRRKLICLMLPAALIMPFFAFLYFVYTGKTGVDPMQFYRWSALGFTFMIILPVVLGIFCTSLMYDENQYDMLKQLWIVPVSKTGYFLSKFLVVLIYSVCFMAITFAASIFSGMLSGCIAFQWESVWILLKKCFEIGVLTAFAMLPILAVAASQKGYIFPVCITLIYVFLGVIMVNMSLHPLSGLAVIIARDGTIPGVSFAQRNILSEILCICIWDIAAVLFAVISLKRRK